MTSDEDAQHRIVTAAKKKYKHRWPKWWDVQGFDHPDVPFPKFRLLLEEILCRAFEIERGKKL